MGSLRRKPWERYNSSKSDSDNNPPWCSSGKISHRKLVPKCKVQSSYPLRENIWEYLHDDGKLKCATQRNKKVDKQRNRRSGNTKLAKLRIIFIVILGVMGYLWRINAIPSTHNLMDKLISKTKLSFSMFLVSWKPSVSEECCYKMRYLALELARAEHNIRKAYCECLSVVQLFVKLNFVVGPRGIKKSPCSNVSDGNSLRLRRVAPSHSVTEPNNNRYINGAIATIGSDTKEWGGRVALWGLVPLWKAAPPPDTVLSLRSPTPADCWPFSGSSGELNILLPKPQRVTSISVEHVRPDTAKSAPKHFTIYGVLANNTLVKVMDNQYQRKGPAKQYFVLGNKLAMRGVIFRVLTNHGNVKYTCIYRIHLYGNNNVDIF